MVDRRTYSIALIVLGVTAVHAQVSTREVMDSDMDAIRAALPRLVASPDSILDIDASWGLDGQWPLAATVTLRPFEVGEGLCVVESFVIIKADEETDFRLYGTGVPRSKYWEKGNSCSVDSIDELPQAVLAGQIATTHVAQIMRAADDILRLATPDVWCNEPVMPTLFEPGTSYRLSNIMLQDFRNVPGIGRQYSAFYTREGLRDDDGIVVRFAMHPDSFEVDSACYWIA